MNLRKGKIDKLVFGNDGSVRGVEVLVYQSENEKLTTIKRPVQLVIPFNLCDQSEPAETHTENYRPKRLAAINVDAISEHQIISDIKYHRGECGNPYKVNTPIPLISKEANLICRNLTYNLRYSVVF